MRKGEKLTATVSLDVQYFPRVSVGPEDPLRVEANSTATLECHVDSKPSVSNIKWYKDGSFIGTSFRHVIPKVTLQDAGNYTCSADNGLARKGETSLSLDVLYPPVVTIEGDAIRNVEVEDSVKVYCNVSSNPEPSAVEWLRDGRQDFRQAGHYLRLSRITADHAGNYTCRAINTVSSTNGERKNHTANAHVIIRVRHKPGPARITPDSPVAAEGSRVILTCMANPTGYPEPTYQWSKESDNSRSSTLLPQFGSRYEIDAVNLGSEGTYRCHAMNEIGNGESASVNLTVYQAPKILTKLQPHVTRK